MSELLYQANPSLIREKPIATFAKIVVMLLGLYMAIVGNTPIFDLKGLMASVPLPAGVLPENLDLIQLLGLIIFVVSLLMLVPAWMRTKMDHLEIKSDEVVWTHGLFNKSYTEINMASVRTVRVSQSLLQRIMNAGNVEIYTSGDESELRVKGMPKPNEIRELIKGRTAAATDLSADDKRAKG